MLRRLLCVLLLALPALSQTVITPASVFRFRTVPAQPSPPPGNVTMYFDSTTGTFTCKNSVGANVCTGGGGGGAPGGNTNTVQINAGAGSFAGVTDWSSNGTHNLNMAATGVLDLHLGATTGIFLPGAFSTGFVRVTTTTGAITATEISGDATTSGSGALTLATVNSGSGACGDSSHVCVVTTNAKGLVTAQTATAISGSGAFQANGTPLASAATINFQNSAAFNGLTATFTNPSAGNIQLGFSGTLGNAGLANSATTVNNQTCTLGSTCTIPIQTNSGSNTSQAGLNMLTSTVNGVGLTVTPTNSGTNQEKFEVTGAAYTGNAATATKWATARNLAGNSVDGSATIAFANKFIVQGTTDTGLSAAQFLGALGTGPVKNTTTTGVLSIAVSADIYGLWSGTCNSTTFLRGDGSCQTPPGTISALTTGVVPQAGSSTTIVNSSPQLDIGVTAANTLTFAGSGGVSINDGSGSAGVIDLAAGTAPSVGAGLGITTATSITPYNFVFPAAAASGYFKVSTSANQTGCTAAATFLCGFYETNIDLTADVGSTVLPVANGGLSLATLTAHALYVGNGTSAPTAISTSNNGAILIGTGSAANPSWSATPTLGGPSSVGAGTGALLLAGATSGIITIKPQAVAGTYEFDFPTTVGTTGQVLTSQGGAGTPMTWTTPSGTGTVTSIATTAPIGGGTITTTGTITCATCTTNASALTSNAVVLGGGSQASKVSTGFTTDGTSVLTLGVAGASVGAVAMTNATSGSVTIAPTTGALGAVTATLPANTGTIAELNLAQTFTAVQTLTPAARASGTAAYFTLTTPADTSITTATESIGDNHVAGTRTWVDGTVAAQREHVFAAPTYNKTTTSATFTKAATLAVTAAPIAGTGVTITNDYALWVQAGGAQFDGGLTSTTGSFTTSITCTAATCLGSATATTQAAKTNNTTVATTGYVDAPTPLTAGTSVTLATPRQYFVCTGTCTITAPVPAAGMEFCVYNDDNVATVITFSAIGSSARYENTARTAYGTAGTGTLVSGGAVGDKMCLIGRDSTHYSVGAFNGVWTVN